MRGRLSGQTRRAKDALAVQQAQLEQGNRLLALLAGTITRNKLAASENA